MTHTKKRLLAMLLAVVLCFSSLPFSVSADEVSSELPTESTVESQPEETPAEDPAPSDGETLGNSPSENDSITISDSSGDVPVVYAIDPYDEIKNKAEGGSNDMTQYGVTRAKIVSHLESHEHDDFYLGTPYQGGDWQSPNGDTSYNGSAGMNCTGFVSYVLRACGLNTGTFLEQLSLTGSTVWAGSGLPYDLMSGASNYLNAVQNGDIAAYTFRDKSELLASGLAQKGDIILMWWSLSPFDDGADNHIGFFWGDSPSEDKMWHSSTHPQSGNQISEIVPKTPGSYFILIKTENEEPTYSVSLTKTSADVSITQGNSAYSLAGATYNVYKGTSGTGDVVATFTTDEAGHATLSTPLEDGTYSVKEVTPPKGYKLDEKIYTFTINGADTSLSVEDEPGTLTLRLKKKDSQTGSTPQGNASIAGAVYQVSYQLGGQTVTQELTSDASGNLGTLEGIPFGTVTVKELTAPEGYRLDTEVHTYTVDGSQLTGDVYELEVDDLTEDVMRGGLTIQKLDSQTGTTPQGDASLEGISFEIVNNSRNPVVVNGNTAAPGQVAMTITTNVAGVATTGENALPYGEYTVREVSTNDSMLKTFTEEISVTINQDGQMLEYEAENEVVRGGIDLEKQDSQTGATPQGNASFAGIEFEIINRSANPVVVGGQTYAAGDVVMTLTTDESGHASTGSDVLPYGTYEVRESTTNESMLLTWAGQTVTVRQNGHSVAVTAVDEVERGGLSLQKTDTITGTTPQGDADFEGITFQIINNSRNPVMVEDQKYQPGEVVKTLVTDSEGKASTSDDLLPYGEYILHESATGSHPPIISREIYEQAQRLKESRFSETRRAPHTFTHRIQCPSCGRFYRHINSSGTSKWACPNRVNKVKDCPNYWISETAIKLAFLNMAGKLYCHHESLLITTIKLLEEIAVRQEQGNAKLYELNTALADLNEKAHTLQRLHNKGFIEDGDFREQTEALASQRKKISDQRGKIIHGSKALATLDKLQELQRQLESLPEIPWQFDIVLFDQLVEKIVPVSNTELLFKLKCGLELKEMIPQ